MQDNYGKTVTGGRYEWSNKIRHAVLKKITTLNLAISIYGSRIQYFGSYNVKKKKMGPVFYYDIDSIIANISGAI